jgi:CheY-like chemotaxis protein
MHIILCTDNTAVRQVVCTALESAGRRFTTCDSGMELLAAVKTLAADVVVLDLGTHGLGGPLLASAVQELSPGLPIVAVSASANLEARPVVQRGIPHVVLGADSDGELQAVITETAGRRIWSSGSGPVDRIAAGVRET